MSSNGDPRQELAEVAASLRAYLEWQVDTGASGIPRGKRKAPSEAIAASAPAAQAPAPRAAAVQAPARPAAPAAPQPAQPEIERAFAPPSFDAPTARASNETRTAPSAASGATSGASSGASDAPPRAAAPAEATPSLARLPVLAQEVAACTKCGLAKTRTQTVFSRGNPTAQICFIGEAPGADEDAQGLPFVGRAGQLLDKMIQAMGLSPENDVYVCNILKCRPPENRRPEPEEMEACFPYLHEQLAIVRPKVIVAMGNTAVQALLGTKLGITKVRGSWKLYKGTTLVMPTYHPSYLLRPSPQQVEAKKQAWEDLQAVMKELKLPLPAKKG